MKNIIGISMIYSLYYSCCTAFPNMAATHANDPLALKRLRRRLNSMLHRLLKGAWKLGSLWDGWYPGPCQFRRETLPPIKQIWKHLPLEVLDELRNPRAQLVLRTRIV